MNTIGVTDQNTLAQHPMQTFEWGEARKKMGIRVEKIINNNSIFQFTVHPIPHTPFAIGYLPRSVTPPKSVLNELYSFGKKNKLIFIKIEPYTSYSENIERLNLHPNLKKSPHALFPEWTQTLNLTQTDEMLFKNLRPKTRYNIRLAEKKGVVIKDLSTDEGYAIFEKLYFETCKRQNYKGHTPLYHQTMWKALKGSQAHILIAFLGDTPLAAYELLHFKERIYYLYGGSSLIHKNVMAPNLLMWEAIKWGKYKGAHVFDMWGSLGPNYSQSHPWAGFTRFKEGYGTEFTHLSASMDLVIHQNLYSMYGIVHAVREKLI